MKKVLSVIFALAIILTMLPVQSFAKSDTVEIYGNKVSVHTKQICFVKGDEDEDSLWAKFYDSSFKKYCYVGDETIDFKVVAEKLPELQNLVVINSDVKNLSSLANLKDLAWLGLHQCSGSENLSFLKNLTGLKKFRYTNIYGDKECESIKPVSYLTNLTELYLSVPAETAADIRPLKGLTKLKKLEMDKAGSAYLDVLKNLKNLRELDLGTIGTADMTFLKSLKKLESLDIVGNTQNISIVTELKNLKELSIGDTREDLSFIGEMTQLEKLLLSYTNETFAEKIGNLKNLKKLSLMDIKNGWHPYSLDFLGKLESLEDLFIMGQDDMDITGISKLKKLKTVSIWLCEFDDLSELKKCKALENLQIYNCNSDFDVKWIENSSLKSLSISSGGSGVVKNMNKLATLKNLESLTMDFTGISEETAKKIKKAVPKCRIEVYELGYGDYETVVY